MIQVIDPILSRNQQKFEAELKKLVRIAEEDAGSVLRGHAFEFAYDLSTQTFPLATRGDRQQTKARDTLTRGVVRDIGRTYLSIGAAYEAIREESERVADGFVAMVRNGKLAEAQRLLGRALTKGMRGREVIAFDDGARHRRNRNRRGRVAPSAGKRAAVVTDHGALHRYRQQVIRRVGTAKGSWLVGRASLLSGTHIRIAGGQRIPTPSWLARQARLSGHIIDNTRGRNPLKGVVFVNEVPWVSNLVNDFNVNRALGYRAGQMRRDAEARILAAGEKVGYRSAA